MSVIGGVKGMGAALADVHGGADKTMNGDADGRLPMADASSGAVPAGGNDVPTRGRGRPPGARNKSTKEWREYFLSQYTSPMIALAELMCRPVQELAAELGYTNELGRKAKPEELLELVKVQASAAKELLPYIHQKQPQAVELGEGGLISLNIWGGVPVSEVQKAEGFGFEVIEMETQQNQGVSVAENAETNGLETNGHAQSGGNVEEID